MVHLAVTIIKMNENELYEVKYSYSEIGMPPEDELICGDKLYIIAGSPNEAEQKAKKTSEVMDKSDVTFETRKYILPKLSIQEDVEKFGLELIVLEK